MDLIGIRVMITIFATLTAVIFIGLIYIFPEESVFILTIETILLPTIYIIGNYYAENLIQKQNEIILNSILDEADKLQEKYNKERLFNIRLKMELENFRKYAKKN